jgi:hypothetical protein
MIKVKEMGLEKKMAKLPPEITRDCLSGSSTMGPRINAIKKGGIGKSSFRIKYPRIPKKSMVFTSNRLFWIA